MASARRRSPDRATGGPRRRLTWVGTVLAVLAMVIGLLLVTGVVVLRQHLLDEGFYTRALLQADVYERTYTEVWADPELADVKHDLVGRVDLGPVDPAAARIVVTNSLRWAVPPSSGPGDASLLLMTTGCRSSHRTARPRLS